MADKPALGIEVLLKLFLCCCTYATQKSDYRKPDPCGNAQILLLKTEMNYIEIIGFVAAILTTSAFLPQVYKTWKTKDVSGLSLPMLVIFFVGIIAWLVYGFYKNSPSMIMANSITLISAFLLIYFKLKYSKK